MGAPVQFQLPLLKKEDIAAHTMAFYFDRKAAPPGWDFRPGQYIRMTLPIQNPDERGTGRFFSVASSPTETDYVRVATKIGRSSFKQTLSQLNPGTLVDFRGPFGEFVLEETSPLPQILLTGGIGITPFISMTQYAADKQLNLSITLMASFGTPEELIMDHHFNELKSRNPHFQYIVTVTHPEESTTVWNGEKGRINEDLLKKYVPDVNNSIYYIVGPEAMVSVLTELLHTMNVPEDNIRLENFTGY